MTGQNEKTVSNGGHPHRLRRASERRLSVAFALNLSFFVFEIAGGLWTNSMAILSDALHDLGDSASLGLSWYLNRVAQRKGDEVFSFGYRRFSLLGALLTGLVLVAGSILILAEAVPRILHPEQANAPGMLIFAMVGIVVNGVAALRLHGGRTLNERVVTWHLLEDVLGWAAVLIVAVVMWIKDIPILDSVLAIVVTLYILWNITVKLKQTLVIFLQGVPESIRIEDVEEAIANVQGVRSVHHTHVWSQDGEHHVLTTHVVADRAASLAEAEEVRQRIKVKLRRYDIHHATIEVERSDRSCKEGDQECRN